MRTTLQAIGGLAALWMVLEHGGVADPDWTALLATKGWILLGLWGLFFAATVAVHDTRRAFLKQQAPRAFLAMALLFYAVWRALRPGGFVSGSAPQTLFLTTLAVVEGLSVVARALRREMPSPAQLKPRLLTPLGVMLLSFPALILVGSGLLMLPRARAPEADPILWHDALFTATSAVCVTGLIVRDTATHFSAFGQNVILFLIQLGGLGIVTFASFFTLVLGGGTDLGHQAAMRDVLSGRSFRQVVQIVVFVVVCTAVIEVGGALFLMDAWRLPADTSNVERFRHSLFHAVSAFCNAGFSLYSDSLASHAGNPRVLCGVMALIFLGGIGFVTIQESVSGAVRRVWRFLRRNGGGAAPAAMSLQARLSLRVSLILVAVGAAFIFLMETGGALTGGSGPGERLLGALFLSVSSRTAGFETFPLARCADATLFVLILLMFVGGSPNSTAGGIKTTTTAVLYAVVRAIWWNRDDVEIARRTVPTRTVQSALVILILAALIVALSTFLLCLLHPERPFIALLFEAVSAFGTVGLSTGLTPELDVPARMIVCLTMLVGRLGPLTIVVAMTQRRAGLRYAYASENVTVG